VTAAQAFAVRTTGVSLLGGKNLPVHRDLLSNFDQEEQFD